jgi:hypothetical protein
MQQWRKLCAQGIDTPNPRQHVLDDLATFLSPYKTNGHEILILLDANSPHDHPAIEDFLEANNLHNLMHEYLPDTPPSTYQRGRSKIDHVWGTIGILTAMNGTGILPLGIGPRSDHAILYLDISLSILSGTSSKSLHDPTHPSTWNQWSTDVKAAAKYTNLVRAGFEAENIAARIAILLQRCDQTGRCTTNDERILNNIDSNITRILLKVERDCKRAEGHAWSPLLERRADSHRCKMAPIRRPQWSTPYSFVGARPTNH